jgi:hypothetical protein
MHRTEIIQNIINRTKAKVYLEIGASYCKTFFSIHTARKIAVDPALAISGLRAAVCNNRLALAVKRMLRGKEEMFFKMTSDDFFRAKSGLFAKDKIDVAFVDGAHSYSQALRDILNCLDSLSEKGVIVIHDCNPTSETMAYPASSIEDAKKEIFRSKPLMEKWSGEWGGDVWKAIVYLRSYREDLSVFVLDCDYGIGIVTRGKPQDTLKYSIEDISRMSYADLEAHRQKFLNLKVCENTFFI